MPVGRRGAEAETVEDAGGGVDGAMGESPAATATPQAQVTVLRKSRADFIEEVAMAEG